jgi:hypothetical protein
MASNVTAEPQPRDWTKWLTASVGVATAITGVIQFYYKEIFAPAKVPVNIALELEIKPLTAKPSEQKDIITALMQIKISNTGNKSVYLKSPSWMAFGMHRTGQPRPAGSFSIPAAPVSLEAWCPEMGPPDGDVGEEAFVTCLNRRLAPLDSRGNSQDFTDRLELPPPPTRSHQHHVRELIASGPVGKDKELKPGQEIRSHILIPVSTKPRYDYIEAVISVPTVSGISPDVADKIASISFINVQDPLAKSDPPAQSRVYQKLRGFCLTTTKPASLVDGLNAFRLPRRNNGDVHSSLGKKNTGTCYTSATIPQGRFGERTLHFIDRTLRPEELNRFGAQFYDATFEVPLQLPEESSSISQPNRNP